MTPQIVNRMAPTCPQSLQQPANPARGGGSATVSRARVLLLCALLAAGSMASSVRGQPAAASAQPGRGARAERQGRGARRHAKAARAEQPAAGKAKTDDGATKGPQDAKSQGGETQKAEDAKGEAAGPAPIVRSSEPTASAAADRPVLKPDAQGRMAFQFQGQKWPAVLQWLADWSGMSLDWQELPGDYLNLTTRRKYTAREARDMINRHLLARGYTMLVQGEVLSVVKLDKIDPAMVPRAAPEELDQRDPHEFVKVSFPLDWLLATSAAKEFQPMLSPHGRLTPLTATNRLEAMDSVANLRQIARVLADEQSGEGEQHLVRKFVLRHTRATEVREQLMALLGIASKQAPRPMTPQQMQQQMQMAQMRTQQQQKKGGAAPKEKPQIYLVAVPRENVILANAPPDKMALIDEAIRAIDVDIDRSGAYQRNVERMNIYRLTTIDPEALVKTLEEIGGLDYKTRLEVDKENRAIIAYASLGDHLTIRSLIQKLDGSARAFHVIQLKRLEAEYVAGTIQFMMGAKEEKRPERRRPYYSFFGPSRRQEEPAPKDQFSVDADIVNNRLLLRANEDELRQVEDLLIKLGEIPSRTGDPSTVRLIEAPRGPETEDWLQRIRRAWQGPNRLEIELPEPAPANKETRPPKKPRSIIAPPRDATTHMQRGPRGWWRLAQWTGPVPRAHRAETEPRSAAGEGASTEGRSAAEAEAGPRRPTPGAAPPIKVSRAPDGRLIIRCEDPRALDRFEELIMEFPPPRKPFEIFQLKYASAWTVALNLEDYFKEEDDKQDDSRRRRWWYYGGDGGGEERQNLSRLSRRRPVKFIYDDDTNSIVVQNASASQLDTIRKLIEFYDQPEPPNSQSVRKMQVIKLQYSRADVVAEAVKDVFMDLLSTNDKARQKNSKQDKTVERVYFDYYETDSQGKKQMIPRFKGLLSLGVDRLSNSLVVSAPEFVMIPVVQMIEELDRSARPTSTVDVVSVGRGVNPQRLQELLSTMMQETAGAAKRGIRGKKAGARAGQQQKQQTPGAGSGKVQ